MRFDYYNPVKYIFGKGRVEELPEHVSALGKKALIVTYPSKRSLALADRVCRILESKELPCVVFPGVMPNPVDSAVSEGSRLARENNCDVIVGLGGGSAMDAAKAIAAMAVNDGDVFEYIFGKPLKAALPVVTVTTTAGTGSEGNCLAVITNSKTFDKKALASPLIYPKVSIVDPGLMAELPPHVIAGPGADALFHAIESYLSVRSNPFSEMLSLKAICLLGENLRKFYKDPKDQESRDNVALANTMAGIAIGSCGTTIIHALAQPLSGLLDIVHSDALASLFAVTMEFTKPAAPEKFAVIAQAMGEDITGLSEEEAATRAIAVTEQMLLDLKVKKPLSLLGVKEEHIPWLTDKALTLMKPVLLNNPIVPEKAQAEEMYRSAL